MTTPDLEKRIASEFLTILTGWFADIGQRVTRDKIENANDYFDANMAMDAAFKLCGLEALDGDNTAVMSQQNIQLWNRAWELAVQMAGKAAA